MSIELVIKIDEYVYKDLIQTGENTIHLGTLLDLKNIIKNGKQLPKGHGRILDEKDILDTKNNDGGWYDLTDMPEYIAGVKAIIEADKAEGEEGEE